MATHLITGAGSGMGRIVAQRLLARGDQVWLLARSTQRAAELGAEHEGAVVVVADLARPHELESLAGSLPDALDSLIHAAGVVELGPVADLGTQVWQEQLAVNLISPAVLTRVVLPALRARRGTVVMVNSGAGLHAHPHWSAYAASKHGLRALADSLRAEEHEHGVRVTSLYPGRTATPMQAKVHHQEGKEYDPAEWIDPATVAEAIITAVDLSEDATITDVSIRPN
ncbi:SDR family oxidoreductase [Nocardioides sp.]|uniref:SDR family oxidoreductase n=1 Tax=Nocardioides sp. TaxID=35761 RepID=UPI003562047A